MTAPHIVEFLSDIPHQLQIGCDALALRLAAVNTPISYASRRYVLPRTSAMMVKSYLSQTQLFLEPYGDVADADAVLAFSFGDAPAVNKELYEVAQECVIAHPTMPLMMQQEIAAHARASHFAPTFSIQANDYQTTADVAQAALALTDKRKVMVVAQAWHAQRCIDTCEALGWQVVGLRCSSDFPEDDPQPWVRHPLNWIIKESHREQAAGYEISERFQLI
ncbi:hypothetical protein [Photobacterium sanguinicancri]|uniref:DUF218 domain-containing protein n=1 Tax=Photobacterium sanguinicancri TaxID=875932 RepID=A0AAW7Y944_9GAMM|nr:hypothetical protein [Photobacterium sanguinicancri]MDO6544256.1 hypothetical protein [Photobacterium sanguinicancri]